VSLISRRPCCHCLHLARRHRHCRRTVRALATATPVIRLCLSSCRPRQLVLGCSLEVLPGNSAGLW
jgi:hypothetical protein